MKITLPKNVQKILSKLEGNGYEAYAVGGCVRDSLMGRIPNDWDITTSALPMEVKALFKRTVDTGIQHGTVTVMLDGEGYEVTTYRVDGEYEDSRHPKEVTFTPKLSEDLMRRDFTINAMAYNETDGLVDLFGGISDMEQKVIRCVGDPMERFSEDALRILRAVRFAAQLGFSIDGKTREAIAALAPNLEFISAERIQVELVKLAVSPNPGELRTAYETGILKVILPELHEAMRVSQNSPHHMYSVGEHQIAAMEKIRAEKALRLTMMLHDIGKPLVHSRDEEGRDHFYGHGDVSAEMAKEILRRLKFDNETIHKVGNLIRFHDYRPDLNERAVRRMLNKIGRDLFDDLMEVQTADVSAQSDFKREEKFQQIQETKRIAGDIFSKNQCFCMKDLKVTGRDLIADGMEPGKELGRVLDELLKEVIREPEHNEKEFLLEYSKTIR